MWHLSPYKCAISRARMLSRSSLFAKNPKRLSLDCKPKSNIPLGWSKPSLVPCPPLIMQTATELPLTYLLLSVYSRSQWNRTTSKTAWGPHGLRPLKLVRNQYWVSLKHFWTGDTRAERVRHIVRNQFWRSAKEIVSEVQGYRESGNAVQDVLVCARWLLPKYLPYK